MAKRGLDGIIEAFAKGLFDELGEMGAKLREPGRRGGEGVDPDDAGFEAIARMQSFYAGLAGERSQFRTRPDEEKSKARIRRGAEQILWEFEQTLSQIAGGSGEGMLMRLRQQRSWLEDELKAIARTVSNAYYGDGPDAGLAAAPADRAAAALNRALGALRDRCSSELNRLRSAAEAGADWESAYDEIAREYEIRLALANRHLDPPVELPADAYDRFRQSRADGAARLAASIDEAEEHMRFRLRQFEREVEGRIAAEAGAGQPDPSASQLLEKEAGLAAPDVDLVRPIPFEEFQRHYLADAIALVRPYPPHREPAGRSHIGGRPDLPAGLAWPRSASGVPLHFLAQVDLSEMPWLPPEMPRRGTLLFFGAMSEDVYVSHEAGGTRILFDAGSEGTATLPPPDLPPRQSGYDFDSDRSATEGTGAFEYPYWPLKAYRIGSMPHPQALDDNAYGKAEFADYCRAFPEFRTEEIRRATGLPLHTGERWQAMPVFTPAGGGELASLKPYDQTGFPWTGRGYALVAGRLLRHRHWQGSGDQRDALAGWQAQGEAAPQARVSPAEAERFIALLNAIMAEDVHRAEDGGVSRIRSGPVAGLIGMAVRTLVTDSGADTVLAGAIPDEVYAAAYFFHSPFEHHQMFGYVGAAQTPLPANSEMATLLQLVSDDGVRMMFGDGGELDFRMSPAALQALDWTQAKVASTSH